MKNNEKRTFENGCFKNKKGNIVAISPYGEVGRYTIPKNYDASIKVKF